MKTTKRTKRIDNFKDFDAQLEAIDFVESFKDVPFEITDFPGLKGQFTKTDQKCSLQFTESNVEARLSQIKFATINIKDKILLVGPLSLESLATNINVNTGIHFNQSYTINTIKTREFNEDLPSKFRCFFPIPLENLKTFFQVFETVTYQDKKTEHFYDCIRFTIGDNTFDATQFKTEEKGYYIIESLTDIKLTEFKKYCFAIQQTIGFISGYMPGGEEYIFSGQSDFYYTNFIRPAIRAMYQPVNSNPFHLLDIEQEQAQTYYENLNGISPEVFSELASKIFSNPKFSSTIILLLESSSVRSFLLIPSVFAVVIESLSKIISKPEIGFDVPIPEKELESKMLKELEEVIKNNAKELNSNSVLKLLNRLKGLNRTVNKEHLTNDEKLVQPFEQLGIVLSEQDMQAIVHRNDLLHGDILLNDLNIKTTEEIDVYMGYISGKLFTLISKLILKYVGYSGYISNHSKFFERQMGITPVEEHYHEI